MGSGPTAGSAGLAAQILATWGLVVYIFVLDVRCAPAWHFPVTRDSKEQPTSHWGSFHDHRLPTFLCAKNPAGKPPLISSMKTLSPSLLQENPLGAELSPA